MWLPAEETSSMDGQVPDTCSGGVLSTVFICLQDLCGIDTQDQVMDQMKNIHFKFKKTCLLCDFDYFGPKSLPYKPLGQRCGFLLKKHQFWIGMFLTPALEEIAFMCC